MEDLTAENRGSGRSRLSLAAAVLSPFLVWGVLLVWSQNALTNGPILQAL